MTNTATTTKLTAAQKRNRLFLAEAQEIGRSRAQGAEAYVNGARIDDNPETTPLRRRAWDEGWREARDARRLID